MRFKIFCAAFLLCLFVVANAASEEISQGDTITIETPGTAARLCPSPNCDQGDHITRIPENTKLEIDGIMNVKTGKEAVMWFEVRYRGERGWISIYDTDIAR